jgi:hypothetical protein
MEKTWRGLRFESQNDASGIVLQAARSPVNLLVCLG